MNLTELQKAIHDLAMIVRKGDYSQYEKLQELRQKHREMTGVKQPEAPKPAPEVEPVKKSKKNKE